MPSAQKKKWLHIAVVSLVLIALSLSFGNLSSLSTLVGDFISIISSILFGFVFAYMMNPIMSFVEKWLYRFFSKRNTTERTAKRLSRGFGIVIAVIVFVVTVYALVMLVFPQLFSSLEKLLSPENLKNYETKIDGWITKIISGTRFEAPYRENSGAIFDSIQKWLTNTLLNEATLMNAAQWAASAVMLIVNALIGIIVAIYVLVYKDTFRAQAKKLVVAMFKRERADRIISMSRTCNKLFSGFLIGKLIDSLIVGVICYVCMLVMGMPYAELISVVIGITNMIPFFGPLLGAIPTTLIILVEDPLTAFYFVIFILILQQIDGNIIGPRILGETVGMSDFWILVSITVFGGLFGLTGMILGVPVFGVIYALISDTVNRALERKREPTGTKLYQDINCVDDLHSSPQPSEFEELYSQSYDNDYDADDDDFYTDDADDFDI